MRKLINPTHLFGDTDVVTDDFATSATILAPPAAARVGQTTAPQSASVPPMSANPSAAQATIPAPRQAAPLVADPVTGAVGPLGVQGILAPPTTTGPVETVGVGKQFATISAAVAAASDGTTILVDAGTYVNDFTVIRNRITLVGVGGFVTMTQTQSDPNGKGLIIVDADATIENFAFTGAAVPDGNGAGVRYQGGNLVLRNDSFTGNEDGLLGAAVDGLPTNTIILDHDTFDGNGTGTGFTHGAYVNAVDSLTVTNSIFRNTKVGNELKSRAFVNTIINSSFSEGPTGTGSYDIDLPDGGINIIRDSTVEKGPNADNPAFIHFGGESPIYANSTLLIQGVAFVSDRSNSNTVGVLNQIGSGVTITGNTFLNLTAAQVVSGPAAQSNNTNGAGVAFPDVPCFCAGTAILGEAGTIAVDHIRAGDRLITLADGQRVLRPVIWVGSRRVHLTPGTDQSRSAPIRIRAHAFADQQPARDLLVSPDHAVFVDGALIPARLLVNHGSITQPSGSGAVDYFHVELDRHAVILSEGLPTESYLAGANRIAFAQGTAITQLQAPADADSYAAHGCAPLCLDPAALLPVWTRLAERAAALGMMPRLPAVTSESDLRVLADGRPLAAIVHGDRLVVALPPGTRAVRIASRAAQPAEACPWIDDRRRIGVTVAGLAVRTADGHAAIPLDAPALADGWWDLEASDLGPLRKTNGDALLTLPPDARTLELHVVGGPAYPIEAHARAA